MRYKAQRARQHQHPNCQPDSIESHSECGIASKLRAPHESPDGRSATNHEAAGRGSKSLEARRVQRDGR